jgi:DNA-binding protein H-NS
MRKSDFNTLEFDELWQMHEELTELLSERIMAEKRELEKRLAQLNGVQLIKPSGLNPNDSSADRAPRRKYPKVLPKYCNPLSPSETWSGRGKQPRWVVAALKTGHQLDEFAIRKLDKAGGKKGAGN